MLDDLKYIHEKDASDALGIAEKQYTQLEHDFAIAPFEAEGVKNVIIAGMGGSGLAANTFSVWPGLNLPLVIVKGYELPVFAGADTLVVCVSYSGNTEETLSVFNDAKTRGCKLAAISSGGKLAELAQASSCPLATLPHGFQPRMTHGYQLNALVQMMESAGLIQNARATLAAAALDQRAAAESWRPDVPTSQNYAKQLANDIVGKSPVIYVGPLLAPAAYKWKISFNENAKNVAWYGIYPEFNHNEFLGWTSHPVDKPYAVIDLRSQLENPRIQKRFEISERLLSGKRPAPLVVNVEGETILDQLLWAIALGDFVSLYVALLNGLNPTPVDLIEKLKQALNE